MEQLYERYITNIGGVTFFALYMDQQDAGNCILSVVIRAGNIYQFQMQMSTEVWNSITGTSILTKLANNFVKP